MRKLMLILCMLVVALAWRDATLAAAGTLDHLLCFDVNDDLKPGAVVDLDTALQPEFRQAGCGVVKVTKFCVPTTKNPIPPVPTGPNVVGQPLRGDYVCYQVKCPKDVAVSDKLVADQFGQRLQRKFQPSELCVPAIKRDPPCFRIGHGKKCGGVCPNDVAGVGTACRFDETLQDCTCGPQPCGGKPDKSGHCGGACPAPQTCLPGLNAAGRPECSCQNPPPPPCGLNPATGTCGGTCDDPAATCEFVVTPSGPDCICQPPVPQCARDAVSGQCGGPCPPGLTCVLDAAINDCRCESVPACGPNPLTGQCGGTCPPGTECRLVNTGTAATCGCATP